MKIEKREHVIWKEGAHKILNHKIVGQYQYIYSTEKGQISCVQIYGYPLGLKTNWESSQWEIMSQKGNLFEDVERFDTKEEAEVRIKALLE